MKNLKKLTIVIGLILTSIFNSSCNNDDSAIDKELKFNYNTLFSKGEKIGFKLTYADSNNPIDYNGDGILITNIRDKGMEWCERDNYLLFKREQNNYYYYYYDAERKCDTDYSSKGKFIIDNDKIVLIDEQGNLFDELFSVKLKEQSITDMGNILRLEYLVPYKNGNGEKLSDIKYVWDLVPNIGVDF